MTTTAKYDDEALEILQAWEAGTLKPIDAMAEQLTANQAAAQATFKKDQRLNIRISSRVLRNLQARALEEGVPYQTFAVSLLHKFVNVKQRPQSPEMACRRADFSRPWRAEAHPTGTAHVSSFGVAIGHGS